MFLKLNVEDVAFHEADHSGSSRGRLDNLTVKVLAHVHVVIDNRPRAPGKFVLACCNPCRPVAHANARNRRDFVQRPEPHANRIVKSSGDVGNDPLKARGDVHLG